jgi:hypothetical protein
MKHLLLIYGDPTHPEAGAAPPAGAFGDWVEATRALDEAGVLLEGDGLVPTAEAVSIQHRSGEEAVTDGPFAETKEALLGYYLIDTPDRDAAVSWGARMPMVHWGTVEVRAVSPSPASAGALRDEAGSTA